MPHELDNHPIQRQPTQDGDHNGPHATQVVSTTTGRSGALLAVAAVMAILAGLNVQNQSATADGPASVTQQLDQDNAEADSYTGDWKDTLIESERRRCDAALQYFESNSGDWKDALVASELDC